jgi:predicted DsbA family dithiol-disulfide isomerase
VRLAKLEQEFPDTLEVVWKAFLLRPYEEPKPLDKFRRYTQSWLRVAEQADAARFRVWSTDEDPPSHSVPPAIAVKAAARQGRFDRYHLALMDAYFYANRNVTALATMLDVAADCGLERERFLADLADEALARAVVADHNEAIGMGITGVPNVVVDGVLPIPGAQDIDFYRHVVRRRAAINSGDSESS